MAVAVPDGSVLVLDCDASTCADPRVIARIAAEEPAGNAQLVADLYLADPGRGRCRALTLADLEGSAPASCSLTPTDASASEPDVAVDLGPFQLRVIATPGDFPQLRWVQMVRHQRQPVRVVTLRDVIGALEQYEPAIAMSRSLIEGYPVGGSVSTTTLRAELRRIESSAIVLNRGLREAVDRAVASGMSMSEIARRCGRTKRDPRGNFSGETSWLARRIGRMPEGGQTSPTPWVHSSTLALIAREGLRVCPREVEL